MGNEYQVLSERIYSDFPIFGSCIRQRAAVALSKDKSPHAVKILAEAVVRGGDRKVITIALEALRNLRDRDSVNAFCQVWAESRHKDLTTILKNRRYVSTEPRLLVLSALKIGALDGVKKRGEEVLEPLLSALDDEDTQIASAASTCIAELTNSKTTDFLCSRWIENQNPRLQAIIQQGNYEPIDASAKALFYFLLGEWQKYEDIDFDQSLLTRAYQVASKEVQALISEKSRTAGRIELIKILTSTKRGFDVEEMTEKDWKTFVDILGVQPDRKEIWRFLYNAPPIWSKQLLLKLDDSILKSSNKNDKPILNNLFNLAKELKDSDLSLLPFELSNMTNKETFTSNFEHNSLIISPNSKLLVSISDCLERIFLFNLPDGKHLKTIDNLGNPKSILRYEHSKGLAVISSDSQLLAVVGTDRQSICLFGLADGKHLKTFKFPTHIVDPIHSKYIDFLYISPDSQIIAAGSYDTVLHIWNLQSGKYLSPIKDNVTYETYWDFDDPDHPRGIQKHGPCVPHVFNRAITPNNRIVVSFGQDRSSPDETIRLWNIADREYIKTLKKDNSERIISSTQFLLISPDGKILVLDERGYNKDIYGFISLWSLPDGKYIKSITGHTGLLSDVQISPNSQILVSCDYKSEIRLWSLPDGNNFKTIMLEPREGFERIEISPNSQILAVGCVSNKTYLFNLLDGNHLKTIAGRKDLVISPDGKILASISNSCHSINLWNLVDNNIPLNKFTKQDISQMESKTKDSGVNKDYRRVLEFTLALIRLRQQFDIDIEDSSNDISSSEFDIEIEG